MNTYICCCNKTDIFDIANKTFPLPPIAVCARAANNCLDWEKTKQNCDPDHLSCVKSE